MKFLLVVLNGIANQLKCPSQATKHKWDMTVTYVILRGKIKQSLLNNTTVTVAKYIKKQGNFSWDPDYNVTLETWKSRAILCFTTLSKISHDWYIIGHLTQSRISTNSKKL